LDPNFFNRNEQSSESRVSKAKQPLMQQMQAPTFAAPDFTAKLSKAASPKKPGTAKKGPREPSQDDPYTRRNAHLHNSLKKHDETPHNPSHNVEMEDG